MSRGEPLPVRVAGLSRREPYDWTHFVAASGHAGSRWVEDYRRPENWKLVRLTDQALLKLRGRNIEQGGELLEQAGRQLARIRRVRRAAAGVIPVLERWYYGVLAFQYYRQDRFDHAAQTMDRALEAVIAAVDAERFLVPLAHTCQEFHLHQARIARNRRRWADMHRRIETVRGMIENRLPLCVLGDGQPIFYTTLSEFYDSLGPLTEEEWSSVDGVVDIDLRRTFFHRFVRELYLLPGFVIQYP